jgi:SAM-dependent methyltransferase
MQFFKNNRIKFYESVLDSTIINRDLSVLVLAAGPTDKSVFESLRFNNVTFSNVDDYSGGSAVFSPFLFNKYDAENIDCSDDSFDYVVIHAALHHCQSPHRALLEMYRVARIGILIFEARDSALMRLLQKLDLTESYECSAVYGNGGYAGGLRNGQIPNYVYRWTEREVSKTIQSYAPHASHRINFFYGHADPAQLDSRGPGIRNFFIKILYLIYKQIVVIVPKQQNLFSFFISKPLLPSDSQPWINWNDGQPKFDKAWGDKKFKSNY